MVILIDSSASVNAESKDNFDLIKNFTKDLVDDQEVDINKTRISIINFSRNAKLLNSLKEGENKTYLKELIDKMEFLNKSTNTAEALLFANELVLTEANGMRNKREQIPRVLVTITDGLSNVNKSATVPEANRLKKREINMIGVGIGSEINSNSTELFELATSSYEMFFVPNFDRLKSILRDLTTRTCQSSAPEIQDQESSSDSGPFALMVKQSVQMDSYK